MSLKHVSAPALRNVTTYEVILIPTDCSRETKRAIANALDIAQRYDLPFTRCP
jgi:nucleotide-binding universal stress UspA family protein